MNTPRRIILKDATLREGLDAPNVSFSQEQRRKIATQLEKAGLPEAEVVAPSRVLVDLEGAKILKDQGLDIALSGLIYAYAADSGRQVDAATRVLDRFDLLMPVSPKRPPCDLREKSRLLRECVSGAVDSQADFGVGFPHSFQTDFAFVMELAEEAAQSGARRITLYDTNGSIDPLQVYSLLKQLKQRIHVPIFFHGHNDLGMATANSLVAIEAGVDGLDVTVNGLGDRAGNAALEQVVAVLHVRGYFTGVALEEIKQLCDTVADASGVGVPKLAPVVGDYVFWHRSPSHLQNPALFEAYDPKLFSAERKLTDG